MEDNLMTRNTTRPDYHQAWRVHERMRAAFLREVYGPLHGDGGGGS